MQAKSHSFIAALGLGMAAVALSGGPALGQATLELKKLPGPGMTIAVNLQNLPVPIAGWQAFLEYDTTKMTFLTGAYVTTQFGLPVINPIAASAGTLNVAAGIDPTLSQPPTLLSPQDTAYLIFVSTGTGCRPRIRVRANVPPTRLSDINGFDVPITQIVNLWSLCPVDFDDDGVVEVQDLFDYIEAWFAGDCRADFNNINGLTVQDIFDYISAWFAGCP
jgi:hypothetical protein